MLKWLKCKVEKGMFSDEVTAIVQTRTGEAVAVFVPRADADDQKGLVRVRAFGDQGKTLVVLPNDHQTIVEVSEADLQST